jgi:MFS transporter, ACS family, D-galactonate transporter
VQRSIIAPAERVTNLRWGIALLLGIGILISSIDRIDLTVAGGAIGHEFGLDFKTLGYLFGAYGVTYAIAQIPAGVLLDRFGVTLVGRVATLAWSLFALVSAAAGSFGMLVGANLVLGLGKAPAYPLSAKATGYWFPAPERGTATAIFDAGAKLATAIGIPLLSVILVTHGWRAMFLVTGIVSLLFFGAFFLFYRDPAGDARLTHAERRHIESGDAQADGAPASGALVALLGQAKVWGITIGFGAYGYAFFLLLTWLPGYLASTFGMTVLTAGLYTAIPWLVAAIAELLVGGVLVDALIARGTDATRVRKTVLVIGMLLGVSIFGATTTHDPNVAIAYITLALAGLAIAAPVAWSLPSLIAPRGTVGTVSSIMNFANIVMAFVAPIVAGHTVASTGSFSTVLYTAAAALIVGALSYVFLLGRIEPIAETV